MILDEFSHLSSKVSRQRIWALRKLRDKRCIICGRPLCERSVNFCEPHREAHNEMSNKRNAHKRKVKEMRREPIS